LATLLATYSVIPYGGVIIPIERFRITTTPKCSGSMPKLVAIGNKTGTMTRIAEIPSMNMPMKISNRLIRSRNTSGFVVDSCRMEASSAGTSCDAISHENTLAVAMIIIIDAEIAAARAIIAGMAAKSISL
jgi:hypothetical protein